jgi:hypothetical protein
LPQPTKQTLTLALTKVKVINFVACVQTFAPMLCDFGAKFAKAALRAAGEKLRKTFVTIFTIALPLQKHRTQTFRSLSHKSCGDLKSGLKVAENFSNFEKLEKLLCCQGLI